MKKITITLASIFLLASCGKETVVVMQPPVTEAEQSKPFDNGPLPEEKMLIAFVESEVGSLAGVDMQLLVDSGYMFCGELRLGASVDDIITIIIASSPDEETDKFLSALAFGAAKYLCPDQMYKFNAIVS